MKNNNSSNVSGILGLLFIILCILAIFNMDDVVLFQRKVALSSARRKVEREMLTYRKELPEKMPPFYTDLPCEGTLTVQSNAGIKKVEDIRTL